MAASTITRGTFVDGTTPWNSSNISALIYDRIDQMFGGVGTYATLELGGALKINGALTQLSNDGGALGTSSLGWSDLFLASGAVINFNNGDVTITHSTDALAFAGAANGYTFANGPVRPATNDGAALGTTATQWSDLFLASGAVINFDNGDVTITHSTNTLTFGGAASGYIFNDGNVGIGVTPSASDIRHLQFGTNAVISGSGNAYLSNNAVYNGAWKYVASSVATMQYSMTSSGHQFDYAAAGTAGNTITFTTALGINTSGHLGIAAGKRFYLDGTAGTGDTYIHENTSNQIQLVGGNTTMATATTNGVISAGAIGVGFASTNGGTSTGTAIVRNADTYFYLTSSSRRFKENIAPAVVTDTQLDAFMATAPSWWDYKGQKNGALGFIAEDLAALPMERYGFNPLVNYDGDGQVESNRDYALIAMHHLVIQRLERKIAALEARIH